MTIWTPTSGVWPLSFWGRWASFSPLGAHLAHLAHLLSIKDVIGNNNNPFLSKGMRGGKGCVFKVGKVGMVGKPFGTQPGASTCNKLPTRKGLPA